MKHKINWRTIVFALFVIAFLVSAPAVVLYTAGYRYQLGANKIVKTGAFNITSIPRGASVFIDDKQQKEQTPAVIDHAMPGSHVVRVQKDGYSSWQKTLEIKSGENTFATNIVLFLEQESESSPESVIKKPENELETLTETHPNYKIDNLSDRTILSSYDENGIASIIAYLPLGLYSFALSPKPYLLLFDNANKRIVLVDPNQTQDVILLNAPARQWDWAENSNALLFSDGFDATVYSPTSNKQETITRVSEPITELKWYPKGYVAVFALQDEINAIELDHRSNRNKTTLQKGSVADQFWFEDDGDWLVWTSGEQGYKKRVQR